MITRQNTNNPCPSNALADLNDNTIAIDEFVNSKSDYTTDRYGNQFKTKHKILNDLEESISEIKNESFLPISGGTVNGSIDAAELTENGVRVYSPNNKPTSDDIGSLPATKTVVDNVPIYTVGENVNHVGKFTVNDKTVLTEDDKFKIESTILYPGGSESTPPTLSCNQRIVIDNPFKTNLVHAWVEFSENNIWYKHDEIIFNGNTGYGTKTNQIGDKLAIQTGNSAVRTRCFHDGNPTGADNIMLSLPYRLVIVKIGD